jgi:hypothetical protein
MHTDLQRRGSHLVPDFIYALYLATMVSSQRYDVAKSSCD